MRNPTFFPGEHRILDANWLNNLDSLLEGRRHGVPGVLPVAGMGPLPSGCIRVRNNTGLQLAQYCAVAVGELIMPEFKLFSAEIVSGNEKIWAIIQEPLEPDQVGVALRIGITVAAIIPGTGDYAMLCPASPGCLMPAVAGAARIIWHDQEAQLGIVEMGGSSGGNGYDGPFSVSLQMDSTDIPWVRCKGGMVTVGSSRFEIPDRFAQLQDGIVYLQAIYDIAENDYRVDVFFDSNLPQDSDPRRWIVRIASVAAGAIEQIWKDGDAVVTGRWVQ